MKVSYTPMIEQYRQIKAQHQQEILFFRLGDFYEMFFEDAECASRELEITLTSREGGQEARIPMCGIPYHAAQNYIAKLIEKGYKVAICEQVEDPKLAKGIVRREVIKIITPGTFLGDNLQDQNNNFLVAIGEKEASIQLSASDISTGECIWTTFSGANRFGELCDQLFRLCPTELLLVRPIQHMEELNHFIEQRLSHCLLTTIDEVPPAAAELLAQHFAADVPHDQGVQSVIGALLQYLHQTVKQDLSHINQLTYYDGANHLRLDASTLRNLEITRNLRDGTKKDTLLSVLDFTKTAMGSRLLRNWLEYPLVNPHKIISRQDAVEELLNTPSIRQQLETCLKEIYDFERILTRIELGTANARDLIALKASLAVLPQLRTVLEDCSANLLQQITVNLVEHNDIVTKIEQAIVDEPPFSIREGGIIKKGYNAELDDLRTISVDSKQWVQQLEATEKEQTGIRSLKVGYNKIFGYYIEVTKANAGLVPANYIRKQTLVNAERYITPELKEFETKILGAHEKIVTIEYHLFGELRNYVKAQISAIQDTAKQVAGIDTLRALSEAAHRYNYVRPAIGSKQEINIKDGRHPVVEKLLVKEMFVPNDTQLDNYKQEVIIITGPNMAGKSTYMRQVALLVLMAQIGSFIPARQATICPVDKIFTRVGASDDLATGQSTFMVEMNEVAHILKNATKNSLIILDEIGRGTSTFDGISIARAVVEYLLQHTHAKTLFATHYHELIEMAEEHANVQNYSVAVKERGKDVVFLRRIVPGGADKSYGIHVAQLAGLPKQIISRAQCLLIELESKQALTIPDQAAATLVPDAPQPSAISLFTSSIAEELLGIDVMAITPIEALNLLYKLQQKVKQETGL